MGFSNIAIKKGIAVVTLNRGKVNALNEAFVEELDRGLKELEGDDTVGAVIFTGQGKFFSFGFDVPGFLDYSKADFIRFLEKFTSLYSHIFLLRKPVIAALNGHTIAGGCMLATACDYRIMVSGKAKISLNEIGFGSSVFAGSAEMLKLCVGKRNAETILLGGAMYSAEQARALGLVDEVVAERELMDRAVHAAQEWAGRDAAAFASIKGLLRQPVAEQMERGEKASIRRFAEIWYSEGTREKLKGIQIHA